MIALQQYIYAHCTCLESDEAIGCEPKLQARPDLSSLVRIISVLGVKVDYTLSSRAARDLVVAREEYNNAQEAPPQMLHCYNGWGKSGHQ